FALAVPAALMAVGFGLFAAGKRHYPKERIGAMSVQSPEERQEARGSLKRLAGVFAIIAVFWFVYDQSASTWIFFARDHLDLELWRGVRITPDQIQGLNPVFILVLTPVFNALWRHVERRCGSPLLDTKKM